MKNILLISFFILCLGGIAQPPSRFYTKFGGSGVDIGYGVKQTSDKGYIVAGSTTSYGAGASDVYLVKVDSMGKVKWMKTFGGFGNDVGRSVIQLSDTGYVITGFSNSYGSGGYDVYTIRTDKAGTLIWQKTFGGTDWDFGYDLLQSTDGNLVVCGSTTSFGYGGRDGLLLKYDTGGNLIWQKYFGGEGDDELNAVINTVDNVLALTGCNRSSDPLGNVYFIKVDLNGDTLFTKQFGSNGVDYGSDLIQKSYGKYIVAGAKTFTNNIHTQSTSFIVNSSGVLTAEQNFYDSSDDENWSAISDTYAGRDQVAFLRHVPVPSFKMQGNIFVSVNGDLWPDLVNSFGGTQDEMMYGIDRTKDGGYVNVGTTNSFNSQNGDVYFIKLDSTVVNYQSIISVKENAFSSGVFKLKTLGEGKYMVGPFNEYMGNIIVTDLFGRMISKKQISSDFEELDLREHTQGIYLITVQSETGTGVIKINHTTN